jgi:nucleoporin POM152
MLNPLRAPFCLDSSKDKISVPIMINQTEPISLELARIDFETGQTETISLAKKALDKMRKQAVSTRTSEGGLPSDPLLLQYEIQKTGIYKIQKIVDKSELEVRARPAEVTVVSCPSARISTRNANRCKGELSDLTLEVDGTPPLKVQYRKAIDQWDQQVMLQSIQPKDYGMVPQPEEPSDAVVPAVNMDIVLARKHTVTVPLNESLNTGGRWLYYISEVEDRLGNTITYPDPDAPKSKNKLPSLRQELTVHDRPLLWFQNCNSQRPLRVAKGQSAVLNLHYDSTSGAAIETNPYEIEYTFTPEGGSDETDTQQKKLSSKYNQKGIDAKQPGVYRLHSVSTEYCEGEIYEPSSCLLHNPPEPSLTLDSDQEFDKCAGRPIGLRVKLEFVGTPPFEVHYRTEREGAPATVQQRKFSGMSGEIMLGTPFAGKHRYIFTEISDSVYKGRVLKDLHLEQEIKSIAGAELLGVGTPPRKCLGSEIPFHVGLQGEAPWKLEYQLLHGGKRIKHESIDIDTDHYTINTGPFDEGGDYTMSLLSVTDAMGCKETLNQDSSVIIQMNKPKAAFASIDGKRKAEVLEGAKQSLPIRLSGEGPWTVEYRNLQKSPDRTEKKTLRRENDEIIVADAGTYELVHVHDSLCPGVIEPSAAQFEAAWISRPIIGISENSVVKHVGRKYIKHEVCEGDEDNVELQLDGKSPYSPDIQCNANQHARSVTL